MRPNERLRPGLSSASMEELFSWLGSSPSGLSIENAARMLAEKGIPSLRTSKWKMAASIFASQFRSPITLILIAAALVSIYLHNVTDAVIILGIVLSGSLLSFWQEFTAANALAALNALVTVRVTVLRDGTPIELPTDHVAPGDVLLLSAGSTIPADCRVFEATDLFVNESALTGESFPVEKQPGKIPLATPLSGKSNVLFQGSHVVTGAAKALVVLTGRNTELGQIGSRLRLRPPETDFERGVRRFGYFLAQVTLLLVLGIFVVHLALHRPPLEALLFSLALAVGLTPQLLPAVISVNLAHGARQLAACKVIVRRLASLENFGSMNVLCSDKTGTLTEGTVQVDRCLDFEGNPNERALRYAGINAAFETGFANPIDEALRSKAPIDPTTIEKLDEIPYDFIRKRLSVLVRVENRRLLILKGALVNVLDVCTKAETADGRILPLAAARASLNRLYEELGSQGYRVLAVVTRVHERDRITREDEAEMTLAGVLVLHDPPRKDIVRTIGRLRSLGVALKVITGDNRIVASAMALQVGLDGPRTLTGEELRQLSDEALMNRVRDTNLFAEIEPNQKERIVRALQRSGHVVGYMGDGINDATALHAADVGISVDKAVDVAKEAADIILLEHDLEVLIDGVRQGRVTFANTLKYIFLATSANFGNMFSMAGLSLFLPFLPLLPKQILLTNLLTDLPEMTIASDHVDADLLAKPQRWDIRQIQRFMVVFGLLSSVFDYATFGILLWVLHAGPDEFRTGWFVESVVSACAVMLIVRSRTPLWTSRPSRLLVASTSAVAVATLLIPASPIGGFLGFTALPPLYLLVMLGLVATYAASAELVKRWFYRNEKID